MNGNVLRKVRTHFSVRRATTALRIHTDCSSRLSEILSAQEAAMVVDDKIATDALTKEELAEAEREITLRERELGR